MAKFIRNHHEYILYDDAFAGRFDRSWFENKGELFPGGRVPVRFFRVNGEEFVLKHYARGGVAAKLTADRYLYINQRYVRSFAEWRILHQLSGKHLPVPQVIAARYRLQGLFYTADLIMRSCRPARPLTEILKERALSEEDWTLIGKIVRKFHNNGVNHPDLNVSNILIDEADNNVILLDFDKARCSGSFNRRCAANNLNRLRRSMNKLSARYPQGRLTTQHFEVLREGWSAG